MPYIFDEYAFKNYLRNHAERNWFSKDASNTRYKNCQGTRNLEPYSNRYAVRVREILKDPGVSGDRSAMQTITTITTGSGFLSAVLAPITAGGSLAFFGTSLLAGGAGALTSSYINDPRGVYFTLSGDGSKWVVEEVPVDGIRQVAINICEWSNQVYNERFWDKI
ncbi:MAG: hypothetical protein I3270_02055 [Candidatus Moeniiplasma glomeromycotorum]|nr:hypothetical protein [Candidatus Moeniiplasma glomeromycotorum]MCE8162481.1 hypothetical protein [Candidatus Moeniiplasma glomeromycotorum]MCE8166408.1 hypothetical protein [Candidatus Moeniiplasma glomeromycotorum]MCE8166893.1 hypothetical protein [Candidatus Moeniiplasma glomeromycotorum]